MKRLRLRKLSEFFKEKSYKYDKVKWSLCPILLRKVLHNFYYKYQLIDQVICIIWENSVFQKYSK